MLRLPTFLAVLGTACVGHAAPMAYFAGGVMTMFDLSAHERMVSSNYTLTPRDAIGLVWSEMRGERETALALPLASAASLGGAFAQNLAQSTVKHQSHGAVTGLPVTRSASLTYTRLLHRWNTENAQANVWFMGGIGRVTGNTFEGEATQYAPALQFDYETTRAYFSLKTQWHRSVGLGAQGGNLNHDSLTARAGVSFWEVDYEETQPWFVLEAKRKRNLSERVEASALLRFINKDYFAEIGVDQNGKPRAALMVIFSR